ncbi:MAG: aspartate/glutamate racemase family protein [Acidobacteriota bacterium]|nr:aspartate/glutamate racemase family protein [Acidobacteriota bacterium]
MGAAVHYYQKLARALDDRGRTLDLVMAHAETARIFEYIQANKPASMADYLTSFLHRLKAAGAEIGIIPAVTPLYCARELAACSPLPLVSIADAVAAELASRSAQRVAVFGTRYVIESGFYDLLSDVEVICPRPVEVDNIHTIYTELLRDRLGSEVQHRQLTTLAHTLIARDKVDAILIAGTDLSLIFNESNTGFPHIDCAAVHLTAILNALL